MDVVDMLTLDMLAMEAQRCLVPNRMASDLSYIDIYQTSSF